MQKLWWLLFAVSVCVGSHSGAMAGEIFKCAGAGGAVTFSDKPCSGSNLCHAKDGSWNAAACSEEKAKKPMPSEDQLATETSPTTPSAQTTPKAKHEFSNVEKISNSADDSTCQRNANRLFFYPSTARIDQARRQISQLSGSSWTGGSAAQRQTMASIDEEKIIALRGLISSEEARNDLIVADSQKRVAEALAECEKKAKERDDNSDASKVAATSPASSPAKPDAVAEAVERASREREAKQQHDYEVQAAKLAREQQQRQD